MNATLGIDVGTSACKALILLGDGGVAAQAATPMPSPERNGHAWAQDPALWWETLLRTLDTVFASFPHRRTLRALALDATATTVLMADAAGIPLAPALMYADSRATAEAAQIHAHAPQDSPAQGATSSLAKALWLYARHPSAVYALHQADWLTGQLLGRFGASDANNALKLGYDPQAGLWPAWVQALLPARLLPKVHPPGTPLGALTPTLAQRWGLGADVVIAAGTTDSTAAFLATGAHEVGDAVTSLGSTLVLKILAEQPLTAARYGVYSHRLGSRWLVGGASNSGGAVLQAYFSPDAITRLTPRLRPEQPTGLHYYPLLAPGERFPHADPHWPPCLTPRPAEDGLFLQGILEGLTRIEAEGYQRLVALGAPPPRRIYTVGGGSVNPVWRRLRAQTLQAPLLEPRHTEAAYGAALLALQAVSQENL